MASDWLKQQLEIAVTELGAAEPAPRRHRFTKKEITIGREPGSDLVLPGRTVSRKHAVLRIGRNGPSIENLSTWGVYIDGRRIDASAEIGADAEIMVGKFVLTLGLTSAPLSRPRLNVARPLRVFIAFAKEDELHCQTLHKFMASLMREGLIYAWHPSMVQPGEIREHQVVEKLNGSDIAVLLLSADLIASATYELDLALDRHREGKVVLIPVIVRPVDWKHSHLGALQPLPAGGKPIMGWSNPEEAWLDVVNGIRAVAKQIASSGLNPARGA